jgi:hypothetical protein
MERNKTKSISHLKDSRGEEDCGCEREDLLGQCGQRDEQRAGVQPDHQEDEHHRDDGLDAVSDGDAEQLLMS